MTTYTLRFDHLDGDTRIRPLTIDGHTAADLAQAVHRHARGRLASPRVDVQLDPDTLAGSVVSHGVVVGVFTLEAVETEPATTATTAAADHIAHGYTMRDLHRAARAACTADRTLSSDITTRYDIAWSAIAEALVTAHEPPTREELVRVGWQAIYKDVKAVRRLYGVDTTSRSGEVASAPRFVAYWTRRTTDAADEGLIERIAVHQVLATLPEHQRQAIVALATLDDYQKAADSLGLKYATLTARIRHGRRAIRTLWFAPETAPPTKGTDRRVATRAGVPNHCPADHEYTPENTIRRPSSRSRRCRACETARDAARRANRKAAAA